MTTDFFDLVDEEHQIANIKVIGVGGGGGNAVKHMIDSMVDGVDFICANTDAQALKNMNCKTSLQIGTAVTRGLGAGANPKIGKAAAEEDRERLRESLDGADMVFITAGMGGGTGTGAAPIIAEVARELGVLTVAVVSKPFEFEGKRRMAYADAGIAELKQYVDSLITIPNQRLLSVLDSKVSLVEAFSEANNVLLNAVQGIADLIINPGMINVDFADVKTVMSEMGQAMMGTGRASGEDRAARATEAAIRSPLLEGVDLNGARGILVNITAGMDLGLGEYSEVGDIVKEFASPDATCVIGMANDDTLGDEIIVTVVATGIGGEKEPALKVVESQPVVSEKVAVNGGSTQAQPAVQEQAISARRADLNSSNHDRLDIPTFLRNQAD